MSDSSVIIFLHAREWRNRQTRYFEGVVVSLPCGFKSRLSHHEKTDQSSGLIRFPLRVVDGLDQAEGIALRILHHHII